MSIRRADSQLGETGLSLLMRIRHLDAVAVLVIVLRAVVPEVGRLVVRLLEIAVRAEEPKRVFREEPVDRNRQVFVALFVAEDRALALIGSACPSTASACRWEGVFGPPIAGKRC